MCAKLFIACNNFSFPASNYLKEKTKNSELKKGTFFQISDPCKFEKSSRCFLLIFACFICNLSTRFGWREKVISTEKSRKCLRKIFFTCLTRLLSSSNPFKIYVMMKTSCLRVDVANHQRLFVLVDDLFCLSLENESIKNSHVTNLVEEMLRDWDDVRWHRQNLNLLWWFRQFGGVFVFVVVLFVGSWEENKEFVAGGCWRLLCEKENNFNNNFKAENYLRKLTVEAPFHSVHSKKPVPLVSPPYHQLPKEVHKARKKNNLHEKSNLALSSLNLTIQFQLRNVHIFELKKFWNKRKWNLPLVWMSLKVAVKSKVGKMKNVTCPFCPTGRNFPKVQLFPFFDLLPSFFLFSHNCESTEKKLNANAQK